MTDVVRKYGLSEAMQDALVALHEAGGRLPRSNESNRKINPYTASGRKYVRAGTADALGWRGLAAVDRTLREVGLTEEGWPVAHALVAARSKERQERRFEVLEEVPGPAPRLRLVRDIED